MQTNQSRLTKRKKLLTQSFFKRAWVGKKPVPAGFRFLLLPLLFLMFQQQAMGQVLTLDRKECTKVEVRFSELVPENKYRLIISHNDCFGRNIKSKSVDTASFKIEDTLTFFFVWQNSHILRIIAKEEKNRIDKTQLQFHRGFPLSRLIDGAPSEILDQLIQLQSKKKCEFVYNKIDVPHTGLITNSKCLPLIVKNDSRSFIQYRIMNITRFDLKQNKSEFNTYKYFVIPKSNFYDIKVGGNKIGSKPVYQTKQWPRLIQLSIIYKMVFSNYWERDYELAQPIPYFTKNQLEEWPRYFYFSPNRHSQKLKPLYFKNCVKGYYAFDKTTHPETKGYVVIPGKFFLPRRLQIMAVDDIPWQKYGSVVCK